MQKIKRSEKNKVQKATESNKNNKRSSEVKTVTSQEDEQRKVFQVSANNPVLPTNSWANAVSSSLKPAMTKVLSTTSKPKETAVNTSVSFYLKSSKSF